MNKKLLYVVNVDWFFLSHRLPIALAAIKAGYEVHLAAGITDKASVLQGHGIILHPVNVGRSSLNPFLAVIVIFDLLKIIKNIKPDIVHLVTVRSALLGGIACRIAGAPAVIYAISGFGLIFSGSRFRKRVIPLILRVLYRFALAHKKFRIIFQNIDDCKTLQRLIPLEKKNICLIKGSGVDLSVFSCKPLPGGTPTVVMVSRLLLAKGIREFIEAASILQSRKINAHFWLVGGVDQENPSSISFSELALLKKEGCVQIFGHRNDINEIFAKSHLVVFPSYYGEGLPKVLLEAAACGRAIITTDHPGCRDAILNGKTGILIPPRDAKLLADTIEFLLEDLDLLKRMGEAGHKFVKREFGVEKVVDKHLKIYEELGCQ